MVSLSDKTSLGRHDTFSSSDLENGNDYENENVKKGSYGGFTGTPSISQQSFQIQIEEMYFKAEW